MCVRGCACETCCMRARTASDNCRVTPTGASPRPASTYSPTDTPTPGNISMSSIQRTRIPKSSKCQLSYYFCWMTQERLSLKGDEIRRNAAKGQGARRRTTCPQLGHFNKLLLRRLMTYTHPFVKCFIFPDTCFGHCIFPQTTTSSDNLYIL